MHGWRKLALAMAALLIGPAVMAQGPAPVVKAPVSTLPDAALPLPVPNASSATALNRADLEAWLDGFMPYALERGGVVGATVAVVKDGEILLSKGYGFSDLKERTPVSGDNTLFRPGSVSKLFTWTAVMQLVEQGKLDLDQDVNAYLDFKIPPKDGKPVTLRAIMTHTAGFEERIKGLITSDPKNLKSLDEYYHGWVPNQIHPVGTTPAYSNYATGLAGYIIQRVSGEPFDVYIDRHILRPLGMVNSSFSQPLPPRLLAQMSKGYPDASKPAEPYELVMPAPAGSLASSGTDMAKFMIAHLQNGTYNGVQILKPETAMKMHRTAHTVLPPLNRMLLGFYETNINGHKAISHGGDTQWFHSNLTLFIDDNVGLYVSMNSLGTNGSAGAIRTALFKGFADRYFPGPRPNGTVDPKVAAEHARMIAGIYDNSRRADSNFFGALNLAGQVTVSANDDGTITASGLDDLAGSPKKWREIAPFVWVDDNGERLAAKVVDGRISRFSIDQLPFMMFDRTPWWKSSGWLLPMLYASLAALVLTLLLWPVAALVRRRYSAELALEGADRKAFRWVRIAAATALAALAGWVGLITAMSNDLNLLAGGLDPWIWVLQILSFIGFFGLLGAALWNAIRVWKGGARRWTSKLWSVVLVIAAVTLLWIALAYRLISFGTDF